MKLDTVLKELRKDNWLTGITFIEDNREYLQALVDKTEEQLKLTSVGVTLPSYDETNAEIVDDLGLIKTLKNSPFKNATTDEAYTTGFANCYNWLNKKLGKLQPTTINRNLNF